MIPVSIRSEDSSRIPVYATEGSAGADIMALLDNPITLQPGDTKLISTGLFIEIPAGYEAQIRPRSGLALKNGITMLNSPATIDSDYRGELKIILTNLGKDPFIITDGMRIAQMVFAKVYRAHFIESESLSSSERGSGGFGHTGVK